MLACQGALLCVAPLTAHSAAAWPGNLATIACPDWQITLGPTPSPRSHILQVVSLSRHGVEPRGRRRAVPPPPANPCRRASPTKRLEASGATLSHLGEPVGTVVRALCRGWVLNRLACLPHSASWQRPTGHDQVFDRLEAIGQQHDNLLGEVLLPFAPPPL
jgi:hypothetical protein